MGIHGDKSQQERDWVLNGECCNNFCKHLIDVCCLRKKIDLLLVLQNSNMEKHQS